MGLLNPLEGQSETAISIVYEEAGDYEAFADELKSREVLEKAAALIESKYHLPEPVTFSAKLCGEPNAYYSSDDNEVIYCYELAADMYQLDVDNAYSEESDDPA
jgi:hypothetical protein